MTSAVAVVDVSDVIVLLGAIGSVLLLGWFALAFVQSIVEDSEFRAGVLVLVVLGAIGIGVWLLSRAGAIKW